MAAIRRAAAPEVGGAGSGVNGASSRASSRQGLTLFHVKAQLDQLQDTFIS